LLEKLALALAVLLNNRGVLASRLKVALEGEEAVVIALRAGLESDDLV
jgi:hypothetical protein